MKSAAKKTFHAYRDVNAPTTQKVASVAHEAINGVAEKAEPVEQRLRDQASKTGEQVEATQAAATEYLRQSMQQIESFVKERPMAASGIAFAAGILAAAILRR
jgi:ElaB/YqjD/DUF883 family membrane-anchored ribosome-binding protein